MDQLADTHLKFQDGHVRLPRDPRPLSPGQATSDKEVDKEADSNYLGWKEYSVFAGMSFK